MAIPRQVPEELQNAANYFGSISVGMSLRQLYCDAEAVISDTGGSHPPVLHQNLKRDVLSHVDRRNRESGGPVNSGLAESRKTSAQSCRA
jgi:hypothetical protein